MSCVYIKPQAIHTIKERANKWKFTDLPSSPPVLWTSHKRYSPGDLLFANCSTAPSKPPAILSFKLNEVPVSDFFFLLYWYLVRHIFYARLHTFGRRIKKGLVWDICFNKNLFKRVLIRMPSVAKRNEACTAILLNWLVGLKHIYLRFWSLNVTRK